MTATNTKVKVLGSIQYEVTMLPDTYNVLSAFIGSFSDDELFDRGFTEEQCSLIDSLYKALLTNKVKL